MRQPRMNYILVTMIVWIFYYFIFRILKIFNLHLANRLILIISIVLSLTILLTIMYHGKSKFIDIIWTFSSWIFVLCFFVAMVLVCEQIIWIRYKINPRIIVWFILMVLWIWAYFSLKTKVVTYEINTNKINKDTKILLVSDIHVDYVYKQFHIKKIQKMIKIEKPDIVLIAWDMMNKWNEWYTNFFSIIQDNDTPIYAVMWNHDIMFNKKSIDQIPEKSAIKLLKNESTEYNWIQIIWLTDKSIWWKSTLQENLDKCNINNDNKFWILITHQPISLKKLENYPIDLEVAGHTHHGQIFWMRKLTEVVNDYWYWKYEEKWKTAIITQWIWTRWLPFRLGTQSEMVIINLKKIN